MFIEPITDKTDKRLTVLGTVLVRLDDEGKPIRDAFSDCVICKCEKGKEIMEGELMITLARPHARVSNWAVYLTHEEYVAWSGSMVGHWAFALTGPSGNVDVRACEPV